MRRLPRIRTPAQAGFVPSQIPSGPLRVPAAAAITAATSSLSSTARSNNNRQPRRYLSTAPIRPSQVQSSQSQPGKVADQELEEYGDFYDAPVAAEIPTQLVYPHEITSVPAPSAITDPAYKPADTADGLEEIGGVAGWWDEPTHWGSDGGASQYVRNVVRPFGPAEKITDPAVLEVLARRAIVEALVVARFAGTKKRAAVDRLFAHAGGFDRLGKIVRAEVVAGPNGAATLKENADWQRVWDVLKSAVKMSKQQQQQQQEGEKQAEEGEAVTAEVETEAAVSDAGAPASQLTPQVAKSLIGSWDKGWRKAELRDPVVKFFVSSAPSRLQLCPTANTRATGRQADPAADRTPHPRWQAARHGHHRQLPEAARRAAQAEEARRTDPDQGHVPGPAQRARLPQESYAHRQGEDGRPLENHCQGARETRSACHWHERVRAGGRGEVGLREGVAEGLLRAVYVLCLGLCSSCVSCIM